MGYCYHNLFLQPLSPPASFSSTARWSTGLDPSGPSVSACLIDLYARKCDLKKAKCVMEEMSFHANEVMWSSFFSSCKEYGNVEFGREAAYKLFELEPYSLVPYFILVDIYGGASLWNEVQNLRKMMNENGVRKYLLGVNSWFCTLLNAYNDFVSDERVVWVDIEGIPLHVWSRETFAKIGNKWGEALDIEDNFGSSFARKRLCILTKQPESILEKFKVIFKGKVFVARAKELFTWNLSFLEPKESIYTSDDESKHGAKILNDGAQNSDVESDDECNVDGVSEIIFSDNVDECNVDGHGKEMDKHQSEDP
ncbi:RNA-directed DNA polymerase, eukaryota, partial [Tanacetum coccineum]